MSRSFWPRRFYWRVGGAKSGWRLHISMWSPPQLHPGGSPWQYSLEVHIQMYGCPSHQYSCSCIHVDQYSHALILLPFHYPPPHAIISSSLSHCFPMTLLFHALLMPSSPCHSSTPDNPPEYNNARKAHPSLPNLCT